MLYDMFMAYSNIAGAQQHSQKGLGLGPETPDRFKERPCACFLHHYQTAGHTLRNNTLKFNKKK